jgi:hypothetical protein
MLEEGSQKSKYIVFSINTLRTTISFHPWVLRTLIFPSVMTRNLKNHSQPQITYVWKEEQGDRSDVRQWFSAFRIAGPTDISLKYVAPPQQKQCFSFFQEVYFHIYVHFSSTAIINGRSYFQAPISHSSTIRSLQCGEYHRLINTNGMRRTCCMYKILKYDSLEEVQYETTQEWMFPISLLFSGIYVS